MCIVSIAGRVALSIISAVMLIVSLALIIAGAIMGYAVQVILSALEDVDLVSDPVKQLLHIPDLDDVTEVPLVQNAGTVFMVIGLVLFAVSFCGLWGAICRSRILLMAFAAIMAVLVLAELVVGGLLLDTDSELHGEIRDKFAEHVQEDYNENEEIKASMNILQYLLHCCGVNGWEDFDDNKPVPSCCKTEIMTATPHQCRMALTMDSNLTYTYYKEGCFEKLQDKVLGEKHGLVVFLLLVVVGTEIGEIVLAILLTRSNSLIDPV